VTAREVIFTLIAAGGGLAGIGMVTAKNLVHAALYLATTLASIAGVFLVLHADFVAMVQLLVYVGAIAILIIFGLMLTRAPIGREALDSQQRGLGAAIALSMFGVLAALIWQAYDETFRTAQAAEAVGPDSAALGHSIFSSWVLPFEVLSLLLLAALIGAIVLARGEDGESGTAVEESTEVFS